MKVLKYLSKQIRKFTWACILSCILIPLSIMLPVGLLMWGGEYALMILGYLDQGLEILDSIDDE